MLINVDLYVPLALSTPKADELDEVRRLRLHPPHHRRARRAAATSTCRKRWPTTCCALMLAHPQVRAARVSTDKPDVYPDCDAVGVEVFGIKELDMNLPMSAVLDDRRSRAPAPTRDEPPSRPTS